MRGSDYVKAQLLGMPWGTAQSKLRKALIFHLAGQLGMLDCYRCQEEIDDIDDFSIEHIQSWQQAEEPLDAFFDVENIAFSHLRCNVRVPQSLGDYGQLR